MKLNEVMRIRDNGKDVIFSFPYELRIGPDVKRRNDDNCPKPEKEKYYVNR